MRKTLLSAFLILALTAICNAQTQPDVKFIADTLVVQADGAFELEPDLATMTFDISYQDKELKPTYDRASQAIQKIAALAQRNGLKDEDVSTGTLRMTPYYSGDRRKRPKSFLVQGQVVLRIRDFTKLGAILQESVTDEIVDFRSLTYSLSDEEAAKQRAVAEAMRRAVGRAGAALEQKGQKVGALRYASLDVKQLGVAPVGYLQQYAQLETETVTVTTESADASHSTYTPPPLPEPHKIRVSATVQCAFQIQ